MVPSFFFFFCIRGGEGEGEGEGGEGGGRGRVKTSSDVAAVMKRERNDWRQEVDGGRESGRERRGSGGMCIIHPC